MESTSKVDETEKIKFMIVGMVSSVEFQRAKFYALRLHKSSPNKYAKPDIRALFNVTWCQYLTKIRRNIGGRLWALRKHCAVFMNGNYFGNDEDLFRYTLSCCRIRVGVDFYTMGIKHMEAMFYKSVNEDRKFAWFSIDIDGQNQGSIMFMLYHKLVPETCDLFLKRCKSKRNGWRNTKIHRLVKDCWIQGGGFNLKNKHMPCENYVIPHDRRGILSMCNAGKHTKNTVQYIISLNPTPWMDYKYVAFGVLVQGEEVLRKIEAVPTRYQEPEQTIIVSLCSEYVHGEGVDPKDIQMVSKYYERIDEASGLPKDVINLDDDVDSNFSMTRYKEGDYCLETDLENNADLMQIPSFLLRLYVEYTEDEEDAETSCSQKSTIIPITEDMQYTESMKKLRASYQEPYALDDEVVQKVTQLDIDILRQSVQPTSSEVLLLQETKNLFI